MRSHPLTSGGLLWEELRAVTATLSWKLTAAQSPSKGSTCPRRGGKKRTPGRIFLPAIFLRTWRPVSRDAERQLTSFPPSRLLVTSRRRFPLFFRPDVGTVKKLFRIW
ncbi:unnamed protein product [Victoria cruziana]